MKLRTLIALSLVVLCGFGCATQRVASGVNPTTGATNYVTVVNQSNLTLDSAVLQGVTAIAAETVITKDASAIPALKNAQVAINGILSGANQQTTDQVLAMLKANGSPALQSEVTTLVSTVSSVEQSLLAKYGQSVAGQISLEILKAINAGLLVALAGH